MAFLKPQSPLKDNQSGNYFYPLTTTDQVILENGSRLNTILKHNVKVNATLSSENWLGSTPPFTQSITVDDFNDTDTEVKVNINYTGSTNTDAAYNMAASCITYAKKNGKTITFYCIKKKPNVDLPIEMESYSGETLASVGSVKLPELINPATSSDILEGKEVIDKDGYILTGTVPDSGDVSFTMDGLDVKSVEIPEGFTTGGVISLDDTIENETILQANLLEDALIALEKKALGDLNFTVTAYLTEEELLADTPKDNTIGIITDREITEWYLSAENPYTPTIVDTVEDYSEHEGKVWIVTGISSIASFNLLYRNGMKVYPLSAKQCIDGVFTDVEVKSYQNGEWIDWRLYFYNLGKLYSDTTGKITIVKKGISANKNTRSTPIVEYNTDNIKITVGNKSYHDGGIIHFNYKIDLTPYNKLVFEGSVGGGQQVSGVFIWSSIGTYTDSNTVGKLRASGYIDTSAMNGEYYIGFGIYGNDGYVTCKKLYLE